ncbi:Gcd10p family protein [Phlyctema vagabunda]|uniref:tRNA (adenine(58)-N(1))-methyltransferase non-catalytic subunit TRM6 n=1 Tax=Phlyctema vagabunda TaxID=108571 RepID=A0ABR4PD59_9HELO
MHSLVRPNEWIVLRLPSDTLKVLQIIPNTIVSLGKYGTFSSNLILDRPYNLTYELLDRQEGQKDSELRIVPATELHADTIAEEDAAANPASEDKVVIGGNGVAFELVGENGEVIMRSNRETIDDSARQTLTMEEIEELKREGTGAGQDLIAKLMLSHTALDQKTSFSLAKYKLLKTKKYSRRFTILPMDVPMMINWMLEARDATKVFELRDESLALVGCWANVHHAGQTNPEAEDDGGRWLVVDETGGLVVAAMAERMGILYPKEIKTAPEPDQTEDEDEDEGTTIPTKRTSSWLSTSNTLTLIHSNAQPNLSLLKYFNFTIDNPSSLHPLTKSLHPISWLQLISPERDTTYSTPPPTYTTEEFQAMKAGRRGGYYRKKRRWTRTKNVVDATRAGSFSGLVVASSMDPVSIVRHTISLLAGGAPIAIYSATIEPLAILADLYSTSRRAAFVQAPPPGFEELSAKEKEQWVGNEDFPLNPTLILGATVQTSKARKWQVLPGRTHPEMTGRGGAEGYVFTGVKVLPAEGRVEARGRYKRKKAETNSKDAEGRPVNSNEKTESSGAATPIPVAKKIKLEANENGSTGNTDQAAEETDSPAV